MKDLADLREAFDLQIDLWLADGHAEKLAAAQLEGDAGALALLNFYADRAARWDSAALSHALLRRSGLIRAWRAFLADTPLVLMPVCAELPFRQDEDLDGPEAIARLWQAQLPQVAIPLLGLPALAVSSGVENGIPSGVQLVAPPWREDHALDAGEVLERGFGIPQVVDPA